MGTLIRVPKKLEIGMAVVVKLDINYKLIPAERLSGIKTGVWLKGIINCHAFGHAWGVIINNHWLPVNTCESDDYHGIIIRSVALDDDQAQINRRAKMRADYRARALSK